MVNRLFQHIRSANLSIVLLFLFVEYVASVTMFMHSHIIDGDVVCHSHFYAGSGEAPGHTHSSQQAKVLLQLTFYVALAATAAMAVAKPVRRLISTLVETCYETLLRFVHLPLLLNSNGPRGLCVAVWTPYAPAHCIHITT